MSTKRLTIHQMKNLMLEALATEDENILPNKATFKKYGYSGNAFALFSLTEGLAMKKGLIHNSIGLSNFAWGATHSNLFEGRNTNFLRSEIEMMYEAFYLLLNQNIIAPGIYGETPFLPSFHVTNHGHSCLKELDILPYDYNGFLNQLKTINNLDNWVEYYLTEAVRCFNAACYQATNIMVGLASEKITLDIIEAFENHLSRHSNLTAKKKFRVKNNFNTQFRLDINSDWKISTKYKILEEYLNNLNLDNQIKGHIDSLARTTFNQFIRLTRNEVSHPTDIVKDETETMLLLVSFVKYVKLQTDFIQKLNTI